MTLPLTEKQERLWRFIGSCKRSPTYEEMTAALGRTSKSNVNRMIAILKKKGFATSIHGCARSVIALDPTTDLEKFSTSTLAAEVARRLAA